MNQGCMKIFSVADLHGSQYRLNIALKNIETYKPDLVVLCGDITQFGPGEVATNFLNQIATETLAIPGNIDTYDVDEGITKSHAINLHMRRVTTQGISFVGIGRELPAVLTDLEILDGTKKKPLQILLDEDSVLVTHVPPYKLQDTIFLGTHGGSRELRRLIEAHQPRVVLCGHIHEDPGASSLGNTTIVNCSIGKRTEGALVEISDDVTVEILH